SLTAARQQILGEVQRRIMKEAGFQHAVAIGKHLCATLPPHAATLSAKKSASAISRNTVDRRAKAGSQRETGPIFLRHLR
ncbi:hypothetical protein ACC702_39610, partial [Rhizobium ruizarguesonis]